MIRHNIVISLFLSVYCMLHPMDEVDAPTLLVRGVRTEDPHLIITALERGADPNTHNFNALSFALSSFRLDDAQQALLVRTLLKNGADPNFVDNSGLSALQRTTITQSARTRKLQELLTQPADAEKSHDPITPTNKKKRICSKRCLVQ